MYHRRQKLPQSDSKIFEGDLRNAHSIEILIKKARLSKLFKRETITESNNSAAFWVSLPIASDLTPCNGRLTIVLLALLAL